MSSGTLILNRPETAEASEVDSGPFAAGLVEGGIRPMRTANLRPDSMAPTLADRAPASETDRQFARCDAIRLRGSRPAT